MLKYYSISNIVTIHSLGVEVYAEDRITVLTVIDWGDVFIGFTFNRYAFLKSTSDVVVTVQYSVKNKHELISLWFFYQTGYFYNGVWQPTSDWINLAITPAKISPNEYLKLNWRLRPELNAPLGKFNFDIVVSASPA